MRTPYFDQEIGLLRSLSTHVILQFYDLAFHNSSAEPGRQFQGELVYLLLYLQ